MNEFEYWERRVRPAFNHPGGATTWKVQDAYNAGLPDCIFNLSGVTGFFEMKYQDKRPAKLETGLAKLEMGVAQRRKLAAWANVPYSQAYVLLGVDEESFLLPHDVPDHLTFGAVESAALFRCYNDELVKAARFIYLKGLDNAKTLVEHGDLARARLRDNSS